MDKANNRSIKLTLFRSAQNAALRRRSSADRRHLDAKLLEGLLVADIGAGTGISSQLIADRVGARVLAIDPSVAMPTAAVAHPLVEFREATGLELMLLD